MNLRKGCGKMSKLDLLTRIQKLSALIHSEDLAEFNLAETSIRELQKSLDEMTENYIALYCER